MHLTLGTLRQRLPITWEDILKQRAFCCGRRCLALESQLGLVSRVAALTFSRAHSGHGEPVSHLHHEVSTLAELQN